MEYAFLNIVYIEPGSETAENIRLALKKTSKSEKF